MTHDEASKKAREIVDDWEGDSNGHGPGCEWDHNVEIPQLQKLITQALIEARQQVIVENAGNGPITISKDGSGVFLVSSDIKWPQMPKINEDDDMEC